MSNFIFPVITDIERKLPFYIFGVGCDYTQENVSRSHGYPNFQWIQCCQGEGVVEFGEKKESLKENCGVLLYPNEIHKYYSVKEPWITNWISFGGLNIDKVFYNLGLKSSKVIKLSKPELFLSKITKCFSLAKSDYPLKYIECSGLIYELLLLLFQAESGNNNDDNISISKLQPVFEYIDKNCHKLITLRNMAEVLNITPEHLCLLFKNIINIRPMEYVNICRINRSKEYLISNKNLNISEIGYLVGFESTSYFCYIFKKHEKLSPSVFRKMHGIYK